MDVGSHFRVVGWRGSRMPRGKAEGLALLKMEGKGDDEGRRVMVNYEK